MFKKNAPLEDRFWMRVTPRAGCWEWGGSTNGRYGVIGSRYRVHYAHRISYELHFGPVPDGLQVLHRCDNPPCVNPAHLWLGTRSDNMLDASRKGRLPRDNKGERNPGAVIDSATATAIRDGYATGVSQVALAQRYGISRTQVGRIVRREAWQA